MGRVALKFFYIYLVKISLHSSDVLLQLLAKHYRSCTPSFFLVPEIQVFWHPGLRTCPGWTSLGHDIDIQDMSSLSTPLGHEQHGTST